MNSTCLAERKKTNIKIRSTNILVWQKYSFLVLEFSVRILVKERNKAQNK